MDWMGMVSWEDIPAGRRVKGVNFGACASSLEAAKV